jgi:hypothetical protein
LARLKNASGISSHSKRKRFFALRLPRLLEGGGSNATHGRLNPTSNGR